MLADPGAAPACAKAASVITIQSQAEAVRNNFPGPRFKLKTLFSQLASDVLVVWLHDVCCQDGVLPQGRLYDFFGDGMIAAHAKFVKKFCGPRFSRVPRPSLVQRRFQTTRAASEKVRAALCLVYPSVLPAEASKFCRGTASRAAEKTRFRLFAKHRLGGKP